MSRRKGLVAAMEEEALLVEGGEVDQAPQELAELPEAEIAEGAGEIEGDVAAIEDAETDAETLGNVQDVMADSVETGEGLSPEAADMANVVVESICTRLGISTKIMPSMESFGSTNSRKASTMLAMEGVGDAIVRVWQAIKEAIISLWKKIVEFVKKIFDSNLGLEKAAKDLKAKVSKITGIPETEKFEDSGICNAFGAEDVKVANVEAVLAQHKLFCERSGNLEAAIKGCVDGATKSNDQSTVAEALVKLSAFFGPGIKLDDKEEETILNDDKFLVGGECIKVTTLNKPPVGDDQAGEIVFSYAFAKSEKAAKNGKSVVILSKKDMEKVCDDVIGLAKENGKLVANIEKANTQVTALGKAIDKVINELEKGVENKSEENKNAFRKDRKLIDFTRKVVGVVSNKAGSFATTIAGKNVKAGKAALNYVSKCSNKYKTA
jgi:hypothetical protein